MTAAELIAVLSTYPADTPVSVGSNGWGDVALVVSTLYPDPLSDDDFEITPILKGEKKVS